MPSTPKKCGCPEFVYKTTRKEHVTKTPCQRCGHGRHYHENYIDEAVPCTALAGHPALQAMKEAVGDG